MASVPRYIQATRSGKTKDQSGEKARLKIEKQTNRKSGIKG